MEQAIANGSSLFALAQAFKEEGMSQREMYDLFYEYADYYYDKNEVVYNGLLDTMDYIWGFCSPSSRLFDTEL